MSAAEQLTVNEAIAKAKKAVKRGQPAIAAKLYGAVLQQQPDHPVAKKGLRKLERQLRNRRSPDPDQKAIDALIGLIGSGQMDRAEKSCRALLADHPDSLVLMNILGIALQRQEKWSESVEILDKAIELNPDLVESYINRGIALRKVGRTDDAIASYSRAIALNSNYAEAYLNRGNVLKDAGQLQGAVTDYERALQLKPDFAEAHRALSTLKKYHAGDPQIVSMQRLLDGRSLAESDRMPLCFALAKAHEDLGDVDECFRMLQEANSLRKKQLGYDIDDDRQLFATIKALFAEGSAAAIPAVDTERSPRPIFIVGMMRSGTSLVEQILASHSNVHGCGELEFMNRMLTPMLAKLASADGGEGESDIDYAAIRDSYIDSLVALDVPDAIITDKMPANFRWIGFILNALPEARIVHVNRDPIAACWSIFKHFFPDEGTGYACDLGDLADYYLLYRELMSFWRELYPGRIYELDYENLTENQEDETRKLLSYCELAWEEQCLEFYKTDRVVRTTSSMQVRRKMYSGSSDAWRQFDQHLQPLIADLEAIE